MLFRSPAVLVIFLAMHIAVFRRHGITAKITPGRRDQFFWPYQVCYDAVGCLVLLGIVTVLAWKVGAELGAPADPALSYSAARPEWYYLFLFQLLKYFTGSSEVIGALVIPGVVMGLLFLMPIVGRSRLGHALNVVFIGVLLSASGVLTLMALRDDNYETYARMTGLDDAAIKKLPAEERERISKLLQSSVEFREAKEEAEREAHRAVELVQRFRRVGSGGFVAVGGAREQQDNHDDGGLQQGESRGRARVAQAHCLCEHLGLQGAGGDPKIGRAHV